MAIKNLSGQRFEKLTALQSIAGSKPIKWLCVCECGAEKVVYASNLTRGRTKSCGCAQHPGSHNKWESKVYKIWNSMRQRCENPNNKHFSRYGGRGIEVCEAWKKFENFYSDMGDPASSMTLDRIDNDKGYFKENVRWASRKDQSSNRSNTVRLKCSGLDLTIGEWAQKTGLTSDAIRGRLRRGWTVEKALTTLRKE